MSSRRRHVQGNRRDPGAQRSSRLNELLREIIAEELNRIDDERLQWVSVTHVKTDRSLDRAVVSFTAALGDQEDEDALVAVFEQHRKRLQAAVGRQTTLRRTPPLTFEPDMQLREAHRIEDLLASERQRPGNPEEPEFVEGEHGSGPEVSGEHESELPDGEHGSGPEVSGEHESELPDGEHGSGPEVSGEEE